METERNISSHLKYFPVDVYSNQDWASNTFDLLTYHLQSLKEQNVKEKEILISTSAWMGTET